MEYPQKISGSFARLWAYDEGYGATDEYDPIQRQFRFAKTD